MTRGSLVFGVLALLLSGCSGRVDFASDCDLASADAGPTTCVDLDGDGFFAGRDGGTCREADPRFEASDCDDTRVDIHPRNVEWLGDGEDWDCDGLDEPELCLDDALDWVEAVPDSCTSGNLVIQTRQTCEVCSGNMTCLLVRVAAITEPWFRQTILNLVTDTRRAYRIEVPDFDHVSPVLVVPAAWSVVGYLLADGCDDADGFVSRSTNYSSCTL
jgi:hypothetical protein